MGQQLFSLFSFLFIKQVALELTPKLSSLEGIERWFGEPVELIIIPSELFIQSKNKTTIRLKESFIPIICEFYRKGVHFSVKCNQDDDWLFNYVECLRNIFDHASNSKDNLLVDI